MASDLAPIVIDFNALAEQRKLNEFSTIRQFGGWVETILGSMFGGGRIPVQVKGSKRDVETFAKTLGSEKRYMTAYQRYGLDDPRTLKNRYKLDKAVNDFQRTTGLQWPFK